MPILVTTKDESPAPAGISSSSLDLEIATYRVLAEEKRASIHDKDIYAALLELKEWRRIGFATWNQLNEIRGDAQEAERALFVLIDSSESHRAVGESPWKTK